MGTQDAVWGKSEPPKKLSQNEIEAVQSSGPGTVSWAYVSDTVELYQQDLQRASHQRDENEWRVHALIEHRVCELLRQPQRSGMR